MSEERRDDNQTSHQVRASSSLNRRQFLANGASMLAISASSALPGVRAEERTDEIDPMRPRPYGERSPFEKQMRLAAGTFSTTPLQDLQRIITPSALHFERYHNGVSAIDPSRYRLRVHGLVDRPMMFTVEELKRFPSVSRFAFIECSGNTRDGWDEAHDSTVQQLHGLTNTSEWTGIKLSTVLEGAEIRREATWMLAEEAHAAALVLSTVMA
jgi:sulfane dehydrogenase subunit SoxC